MNKKETKVRVMVRERVRFASRLNARGENDYRVETERIFSTIRIVEIKTKGKRKERAI